MDVLMTSLDRGHPIDSRDDWQGTFLHRAAAGGHNEIIKMLLERGAKFDLTDAVVEFVHLHEIGF